MMLEVTGYQRVELNGKVYDLTWYGDKATIRVHYKNGLRTLNGHGKANRSNEAAQVIAKAKQER